MAQEYDIENIISEIESKYIPDKRVEVFQIETHHNGESTIIRGATTSRDAFEELKRIVELKYPDFVNSIRLLPDSELGEETVGLIYNSVGTIRFAPRYNSEMITQVLLGTTVKILEEKKGWLRIQTPDLYIGWINGSVKPLTKKEVEDYQKMQKVVVTSTFATAYESPDDNSTPVSDLVIGNILVLKSLNNDYYSILYPDGREAFIKISDALTVDKWYNSMDLSGESIVKFALRLKGIPYLWGGTSSKGMDCSGFTKNVYFMHGIVLPRDASQQVTKGKLIDSKGDFNKLKPGDLIFFGTKESNRGNENLIPEIREFNGERVVHVGIYIGNSHFIHASDFVRINSLNPDDALYDKFNANRYLRSKRYIEDGNPVNVNRFI